MPAVRQWAWLAVSLLVVAGCSNDGSEDKITTSSRASETSTAATASTTTTSTPPAPGEALRDVLDEEPFSARVEFEGSQTSPAGVIRSFGEGTISGDDSEAWKVSDASGLTTTYFDVTTGELIGIGGLQSVSDAIKVVEGHVYRQRNGGPWLSADAAPVSAISHVFDALADVDEFQTKDTRTVNGTEFWVLEPVGNLVIEPGFLGADPSLIEGLEVDTEILVDAHGTPTEIGLTLDYRSSGALDTVETTTYRVFDVGDPAVIERPSVVMTTLTAFDFELIPDSVPLVDFLVPDSWQVSDQGPGYLSMVTDELVELSVSGFTVPPGLDIDGSIEDLLTQLGFVADTIMDPGLGVYPGRLATALSAEDGFRMVYAELRGGAVGVLVQWYGPPFGDDLQQKHFERLIRSLRWLGDPEEKRVVPGDTLGDGLLQEDTLRIVLTFAGALGCDDADVVWTTPIEGDAAGWSEYWYVSACTGIDQYRVDYTSTSDGGTDILTSEPQHLGEGGAEPLEPSLDLNVVASRLGTQPALLDVGADADPLVVASAVTRARFHGANLYVWVLAETPEDTSQDLAGDLLDELGLGTVLIVSPEWVWWASEGDIATMEDVDSAGEFSLDGATDESVVTRFVDRLLGDA